MFLPMSKKGLIVTLIFLNAPGECFMQLKHDIFHNVWSMMITKIFSMKKQFNPSSDITETMGLSGWHRSSSDCTEHAV